MLTVPVTNVGKREGAEIVQLYICDKKSSLSRPEKELKGFCKVKLAAGETKTVSFTIDKSSLSFLMTSSINGLQNLENLRLL